MKVLFKEEQKFTQWWLWLLLIAIGLIPIYGIYRQLIQGETFGDRPMSDSGLIFFAIFTFGIIALFWFMRLKTEMDQNEIRMSFVPFLKKTVQWKSIESAKIVNYGLSEVGALGSGRPMERFITPRAIKDLLLS